MDSDSDNDFDLDLVLDDKIEVQPADDDLTTTSIDTFVGKIHFTTEKHKGIGFQLWPACLAMCHFIEQQPREFWREKRILELGAGIGVASIMLGKLGAKVIATDLEQPCEILEQNVKDNDAAENVQVRVLDWGNPGEWLSSHPGLDFIIACDCVYWEQLFDILLNTLLCACKVGSSTTILLSQVKRRKVEKRFFQKCKKHFEVEVVASTFPNVDPELKVSLYRMTRRCKASSSKSPAAAAVTETNDA